MILNLFISFYIHHIPTNNLIECLRTTEKGRILVLKKLKLGLTVFRFKLFKGFQLFNRFRV